MIASGIDSAPAACTKNTRRDCMPRMEKSQAVPTSRSSTTTADLLKVTIEAHASGNNAGRAKQSNQQFRSVEVAKRQPEAKQLLFDFNQAGCAKVLYAHQLGLSAGRQISQRLNVQKLQSLARSNGEIKH